jgi:hypothetical protein
MSIDNRAGIITIEEIPVSVRHVPIIPQTLGIDCIEVKKPPWSQMAHVHKNDFLQALGVKTGQPGQDHHSPVMAHSNDCTQVFMIKKFNQVVRKPLGIIRFRLGRHV